MFSVITYNTHLFDGVGLGVLPTFEDEIRLSKLIAFLQSSQVEADIVGLTEVWSTNNKKRVIDQCKAKYPHSFYFKSSAFSVGDGLVLLSKHPLSDETFEAFKDRAGDDNFSQKGILSVKANMGGQAIRLFLTHTQAAEEADDKAARLGNLTQIQNLIRNKATDLNEVVIVMGDLNVIAEDPNGTPTSEYATALEPIMKEVGLHDVYRTLHLSAIQDPGFTFDGNNNGLVSEFAPEERGFRQRLDYVFSSATSVKASVQTPSYASPEKGGTEDLSDHYLLQAELDLAQHQKRTIQETAKYTIVIETVDDGDFGTAGTDSDIYLKMWGENGRATDEIRLNGLLGGDIFERGDVDTFIIERGGLGVVTKISLRSAGNDDWEPKSVKIRNPDGSDTVFEYGVVINKDSAESTITRNAVGFPKQVRIASAKRNIVQRPQIQSMVNLSDEPKQEAITLSLDADEQILISETQLRGSSVPTGTPFLSAKNKLVDLDKASQDEWEKELAGKRVDKESHTLSVSETTEHNLPPQSLTFVEGQWESAMEEGVATWGEKKYGVRWLAQKPVLSQMDTKTFMANGEGKVPYRFKRHLISIDRQDVIDSFGGTFMNPPAIQFDGANDFAVANEVMKAFHGKALSFGCWANPATSTNPDGTLLAFNTLEGGNFNMIGFDAQKKNFFYFDPENSYQWSGGEVQFDQWYHVLASIDEQGNGTLFVNGEATVRFLTHTRPTNPGRFSIGQEWDTDTPSDFFKGQIADVQIWNRAFAANEVRAILGTRLNGDEESLAAYWPVDDETGGLFKEKVHGHDALLIGGQWALDTDIPVK